MNISIDIETGETISTICQKRKEKIENTADKIINENLEALSELAELIKGSSLCGEPFSLWERWKNRTRKTQKNHQKYG